MQATLGPATATDDEAELPSSLTLAPNYPNPFNPSTTITFGLPQQASVRITVFDVTGRQVMTLPMGQVQAGAAQTVQLDASRLASGVYFYQVVAQTATRTSTKMGEMTLLK